MTTLPTFPPGKLLLSKDPHKVDEHGLIHTVSYAAQTPWIRHQSIRDNILFGQVYEERRYREVVECCALESDFEILEDGDRTEVGTRWAPLSSLVLPRVSFFLFGKWGTDHDRTFKGVQICLEAKGHAWPSRVQCTPGRSMCYWMTRSVRW